jgi:protease-4
VLRASGAIVNSQALGFFERLSGQSYITEKNVIPLLKRLQEERRVAAVVLYIDSGGGDGFISDKIWKAIMELKEKKPVIVVMGNVAASGGYYLSMAGDTILAHRTTLTGSIGAYSYKLVVEKLLEKYGISTDSIKFGENFDFFSPFHRMSEEQRQKLASINDAFVRQFYCKVSEARGLGVEEVEKLGGGRIYSGQRALELKLVDEIGGVYQALRHLEQKLNLTEGDYRLVYYPDWRALLALALQNLEELQQEGYSLRGLLEGLALH